MKIENRTFPLPTNNCTADYGLAFTDLYPKAYRAWDRNVYSSCIKAEFEVLSVIVVLNAQKQFVNSFLQIERIDGASKSFVKYAG